MKKRDYQKSRLYAWEQKFIAPLDKAIVDFCNLQAIVDYVWKDLGLEHPPQVEKLPAHNHSCWADATRMKIRVQERGCPTWVILHEIAHSLTSDFEGHSHAHGPKYVGQYVNLICRYVPAANRLLLLASLNANKVDFTL